MGVREEWQERYGRPVVATRGGDVWHHLHPRVKNAAHCDRRVQLYSQDIRSAPPLDGHFCERCEAIASGNAVAAMQHGKRSQP